MRPGIESRGGTERGETRKAGDRRHRRGSGRTCKTGEAGNIGRDRQRWRDGQDRKELQGRRHREDRRDLLGL